MHQLNLYDIQPCLQDKAHQGIICIKGLGVQYTIGSRRDGLKSRVFDVMQKRRKIKERIWALRDVDLTCFSGEIIGVIGANGAGKTTLCRVLSELIKPDLGSVEIGGMVSALFSLGTGFRKDLSGRENILLNGMMLGFSMQRVEEITRKVIDFSELGDFIDQPLKYFSSGMKSRLGFSIASMMEPEILVLDEALSTGDLNFSEKAGGKLKELIGKSKLVIVVTHKMGFVKKYCTRALWMNGGKIVSDGRPEEVIKNYLASSGPKCRSKRMINLNKTNSFTGTKEMVLVDNIGVKYFLKGKSTGSTTKGSGAANEKTDAKNILWALRDVSFSIKEGEVVGIIGPNAAGKTTLCRALCGILKPDSGKVNIYGRVTALLTYQAGFKFDLSGKDNIYLNGLLLGLSKNEVSDLFSDIVEFSEIKENYISQPVKHYSKGMRARLGFSIASMIQPDVFILDEALNAGDVSFYEKASIKIQELIKDAKATIIVTHNISFIEKVCTRAVLLDKGQVLFDGSPKEAVTIYRSSV